MKKLLIGLAAGLLTVSLTGCRIATVVRIGEEETLIGGGEESLLDVASFWDSQVLPEIEDSAVDLSQLLTDAAGDLSTQEAKAHKTQGSNGIDVAVHAEAEVVQAVTDKKAGYVTLSLPDYTGETVINLQTGSVIKKTSVRDYLSFINVNDYSDQIEYAQLSKNINAYIMDNVLSGVDAGSLVGKTIEFYGCFTYEKDDEILITPVTFTVK